MKDRRSEDRFKVSSHHYCSHSCRDRHRTSVTDVPCFPCPPCPILFLFSMYLDTECTEDTDEFVRNAFRTECGHDQIYDIRMIRRMASARRSISSWVLYSEIDGRTVASRPNLRRDGWAQ